MASTSSGPATRARLRRFASPLRRCGVPSYASLLGLARRASGPFSPGRPALFSNSRYRFAFAAAAVFGVLLSPGSADAATVRDAVGRSVEVPREPRRIVSLAPNLTEMLFALGLGERVAGITDYCDWPPEVAAKPRIGGVINPSLETIVALAADLVFATADGNRPEDVNRLAALGVAVYTIDTRSVGDVLGSLVTIGELTGRADKAREIASGLDRRREAVRARVARLAPVTVFVAIDRAPLISAGDGTFVGELLTLAGGRNIAGASPVKYPVFSLEQLLADDPEVILDAADPGPVTAPELLARWRALPGTAALRAMRTGRMISVGQGSFFRPGPRIIDSLEKLAAILHPAEAAP
jgi:iron complex transport system substrate-binding protein